MSPDGQWTKQAVTRFTELSFGKVLVADVSVTTADVSVTAADVSV